ncbi:hypothetical protein QR680_005955 [Steinernema hermaphroditum]|uniref:RING-type domain-containing protein n=1 Tax=Steinernema hermaphroditum TaxID=289476 RepID=A0AA39HV74_9BILA|nr:hypothetical protein QR680_005955 [Steinernema hermaphroditum]
MNYFNKTALVTNEMLELIVCNNPNCKIQTEDQWFLGCKHTFCWDCVRKFRSQKGMSLCPVKSCGMLFAGEPKPCTYIKEVAGILRALKQAIEDMNNDPAVLTQNPMTQAEVRAAVDAIERNTEDQTVDQFMCSQQFFASQHQCIYPDSQALAAPFPFSQAVVESHLPCSQVLSGSDMPAISGVLTQQLGPEEPLFASQFQPAPLQSAKTAKRTRKSKQIKQIEKKEPVVLDEMPLFASQFQSPANVTKRRGKENTTPFQNSAPIFTQESLFASQFPVPITSTTSIKDNKIATLGEPLFDNREPVRLSHFQTKPKATYGNITPTVAPIVAGKRETKSSRTTSGSVSGLRRLQRSDREGAVGRASFRVDDMI